MVVGRTSGRMVAVVVVVAVVGVVGMMGGGVEGDKVDISFVGILRCT